MRLGKITRVAVMTMLPFMSVGCGEVVRQGRSPVFLVIDSLQGARGAAGPAGALDSTLASDVITNVTSPEPCSAKTPCPTIFADRGQIVLRLSLKDIGNAAVPASPSTNNEVTINRYRVAYRRADARNTPGVDVPFGFDGAVTGTVPNGGTLTLTFELVRVVAKEEPPLVQLVTSPSFITTIADVTFYGRDQVGNEVAVTGSIQIDFGNFGDF
jgi:hypothetical protein